jgi:hypothetical protein
MTGHSTNAMALTVQGAEPTFCDAIRCAVGGLLVDVPKGWLSQVIPVSVQALGTVNTSWVLHAFGSELTTTRSVAILTTAVAGMAGEHKERSNWTYMRRLAPLEDVTFIDPDVPKFVLA